MIGSAKINLGSLFFCVRFYFHILPSRKFTTVIKSDGFENIFKAITVKLVKLVDLHIYFFRRFGRNRDHIVKSSFSFQQSKISTILTISRTSNQIALPMTKRFSESTDSGLSVIETPFCLLGIYVFQFFFVFLLTMRGRSIGLIEVLP